MVTCRLCRMLIGRLSIDLGWVLFVCRRRQVSMMTHMYIKVQLAADVTHPALLVA